MTAAARDELLIRLGTLVDGNGGKGILTRLDDIEKWIRYGRLQMTVSWVLTVTALGTLLTKLTGAW